MIRIFVFFAAALGLAAQAIPGRYLVELQNEPAAAVSAAKRTRYNPADPDVIARRARLQTEHTSAQGNIRNLGGTVTRHYDTVFNGMAVDMSEQAAARVRQMPNVKGVYRIKRYHPLLDHAVNVHRISDAWKTLANGQAGAGAGVKIGIIDTGIDPTHPAFGNFSTPVPNGFPIVSKSSEAANTNNKIIVSRFYLGSSGVDVCGHGTSVAMAAAGLLYDPQVPGISPFSGAAPGAWLGNYRVADDSCGTDSATFIQALQDAVNDGMNIVNYSFGGPVLDASDETGPESKAIDAAVAAGVIVVVAAGNSGPQAGTVSAPAASLGAIAAAASENERFFWNAASVGNFPPVLAVLAASAPEYASGQLIGPIVDVTALDGNGFGCSPFPSNSLVNQIALIQRSPVGSPTACTFDAKLNDAALAGAMGAIVYDSSPQPLFDYSDDLQLWLQSLTTATLPVLFISHADGLTLQSQANGNPGAQVTLDFDGITPLPRPSNMIAPFSSAGPTPSGGLKPDVTAVGDDVISADLTLYGGYGLDSGTSYSAPLTTGSLAVLESARPGLTAAQYRSLIVNSSPPLKLDPDGTLAKPQVAGAGRFDLINALQNNLSATPTAIGFGTTAASATASKTLTFTNIGQTADTFSVVVNALDTDGAVPAVDVATFNLAAGASQQVVVSLNGSGLAPGEYHGFLTVTGTQTAVATRLAYWLGVSGTTLQAISILFAPQVSSTGSQETIYFRYTDSIGLPLDGAAPAVTTANGRARVVQVYAAGDLPGTWGADIVVGRPDANGYNTFTITSGSVTVPVPIYLE